MAKGRFSISVHLGTASAFLTLPETLLLPVQRYQCQALWMPQSQRWPHSPGHSHPSLGKASSVLIEFQGARAALLSTSVVLLTMEIYNSKITTWLPEFSLLVHWTSHRQACPFSKNIPFCSKLLSPHQTLCSVPPGDVISNPWMWTWHLCTEKRMKCRTVLPKSNTFWLPS